MNGKSFSTSFLVDRSPQEVFDAVADVRRWWGGVRGRTDGLGAEFEYRHGDLHRSVQKITEWIPGRKIVWRVVEGHLSFVEDQTEWEGTDIVFEIARKGRQTELRFTHVGLAPPLECYGACSSGWAFYIDESLRALLTTGTGQPDAEEVTASG